MSIQSEINRIISNVSDTYDEISAKGGTVPAAKTSGNLANAVASISIGASTYAELPDKPQINSVELSGNKTLSQLGIASESGLTTHTNNSTIHVTSSNKTTWDGKYSKPSGGIPKTDLASSIQTSLGKADTALQPNQNINVGNVNATGIVKTEDTLVIVDDVLESKWTSILGDISYSG